ncbi:D-2-hydroxyacid dehydrogenase [Schumannella luteola]|nr:D-2-hydroxyacid dehydrogenase [Schumannella luteola]
MGSDRLRVVVAAPLSADNAELLTRLEPRIELVHRPELVHEMRWPADFSPAPGFARSPEQQAELDALIDGADALYGIPDVDPAALARAVAANPRLRWVHTMAAGGGGQVKAAGLDADQLARVAFSTSAGVHGGPLAEFAVFGVLAGAKSLPRLLQQQRAHDWSGRWLMGQISAQRVLVAGLGGIGAVVAKKLAALDVEVIGLSRRPERPEGVASIVHPDDLLEVMPTIDALVTTLPGTAATEGLLNAEVLAAARPGLTLVSVGRGTVIDEPALIEALRSGQVGFAALDVAAVEPLATDSPLWDLPNALISPHTAGLDADEDRRIAELFARNATRLLDGEELINRVDTVEFY